MVKHNKHNLLFTVIILLNYVYNTSALSVMECNIRCKMKKDGKSVTQIAL